MIQQLMILLHTDPVIPFMILAFLAVGLVVILERFFLLQFVYRINFKKFNSLMKSSLTAGDLARAKRLCAGGGSGVPFIVHKVIEAYESNTFTVPLIIQEELMLLTPRLHRHLAQLPQLATSAVLLGCFSTVQGLYQMFQSTAVFDVAARHALMQKDMGVFFMSLMLSLAVSFVLLLPYWILEANAFRLEDDVHHSLTCILNILAPPMPAGGDSLALMQTHASVPVPSAIPSPPRPPAEHGLGAAPDKPSSIAKTFASDMIKGSPNEDDLANSTDVAGEEEEIL